VLSLTNWKDAKFSGGETMLLQDSILDFWRDFDSSQGIEHKEIVRRVAPEFGRMTIFDPRIPHGVCCVEGTHNPLESRIVIHGWFTEPTAFFQGDIDEEGATDVLNQGLPSLYEELGKLPAACGTVTLRLVINSTNQSIEDVRMLTNTLKIRPQSLSDPSSGLKSILECIYRHVSALRFDRPGLVGQGGASITLPFIFD